MNECEIRKKSPTLLQQQGEVTNVIIAMELNY